jgi:hypothetical protein
VHITASITAAGLLACSASLALSLSACGSNGPSSAASVVTGDGYAHITQNATRRAQVTADFGTGANSFGQDVTSTASGINDSGGEEVVLIMNAAGTSQVTPFRALLQAALPGTAVTVSGNVLKVDGSQSAFASLPGS